MAPADPPSIPRSKALVAAGLRRMPFVARSGLGSRYVQWQRKRRRARRRAAELNGDRSLSRTAMYDIDQKLDRWIGDVRGGFFVEAGANDGFEQSNTYHLERFRGWSGLLVEPTPHLHREALIERPGSRVVRAALAAPEQHGQDLTLRYGGLMTLVAGTKGSADADAAYLEDAFELGLEAPMEFTAPARTLSSLLDEMSAPEIDFMSLDIEGFEPQALRGLDLDRHGPRYLLVEIRDDASRRAVDDVLGSRYREREQLSPHDVLFARGDIA